MRPPRCDVCDAPAHADGLITCVQTDADAAWHRRATESGLAGHPPNVGWFCAEHVERARALAAQHPLREVVAAIRGSGVPASHSSMRGLHADLVAALPALAAHAGIGDAPVEYRVDRDWEPMDGAVPPNCPFMDGIVHEVRDGDVAVRIAFEIAYWNDDEPARSYLTCVVDGVGERNVRISAASPASGAPDGVEAIVVKGNPPPAVRALLA